MVQRRSLKLCYAEAVERGDGLEKWPDSKSYATLKKYTKTHIWPKGIHFKLKIIMIHPVIIKKKKLSGIK